MYQNRKVEEIENYRLNALVASKKIKKFQRSGKWVTIGVDPIREIKKDYLETSKREKFSKKAKERK
jgi:hypothetical protein